MTDLQIFDPASSLLRRAINNVCRKLIAMRIREFQVLSVSALIICLARESSAAISEFSQIRSQSSPNDDSGRTLRSVLHHAGLKKLDQEEKAIRSWAAFNRQNYQSLVGKFPKAVHDCGLYANDCNYKGTGSDRHVAGSYMKQARLQALAQSSQASLQVRLTPRISSSKTGPP